MTVIDVPCGFGRHSLLASAQGYNVYAVDIDDARIANLQSTIRSLRPSLNSLICSVDDANSMKLSPDQFDVAIITDFVSIDLIFRIQKAIKESGYLIFETFTARGDNWKSLPRPGEIKGALERGFEILKYKEKSLSRSREAATVKALARRKRLSSDPYL